MSVAVAKGLAGLGSKRTCRECSGRFYDLERRPIACPKCGAVQDESSESSAPAPSIVLVEDEDETRRARMLAGLDQQEVEAVEQDDDDTTLALLARGAGADTGGDAEESDGAPDDDAD